MKTRFSKQALIDALAQKAERLEAQWGFNARQGTSQLAKRTDEAKIAYGQYDALLDLLDEIEGDYLQVVAR